MNRVRPPPKKRTMSLSASESEEQVEKPPPSKKKKARPKKSTGKSPKKKKSPKLMLLNGTHSSLEESGEANNQLVAVPPTDEGVWLEFPEEIRKCGNYSFEENIPSWLSHSHLTQNTDSDAVLEFGNLMYRAKQVLSGKKAKKEFPYSHAIERIKNRLSEFEAEPIDDFVSDKAISIVEDIFASEQCPSSQNKPIILRDVATKHNIVLMFHPCTVSLRGHMMVEVLKGAVRIHGFELFAENNRDKKKSVEVFSESQTGVYTMSTIASSSSNCNLEDLEYELNSYKKKSCILQNYIPGATVVRLIQMNRSRAQEFASIYYPYAFGETQKSDQHAPLSLCSSDLTGALHMDDNHDKLSVEVKKMFYESGRNKTGFRVFMCGPSRSGKSTCLRFLLNGLTNNKRPIYYLDLDPGQTEFTPPGVISLIRINGVPLLGPPYTHLQEKAVVTYFVGSATPKSYPSLYKNSLDKLMKLVNQKYANDVIFANTMGWVQGFGLEFLVLAAEQFQPNLVLEMQFQEEAHVLSEANLDAKLFVIYSQIKTEGVSHLPSKDMREIALATYFGGYWKHSMGYIESVSTFQSMIPYKLKWENIGVCILGEEIEPRSYVRSIANSVVALCHVDKDSFLCDKYENYPLVLKKEYDHTFIGYGHVRAIDECERLLYITTPVHWKDILHVNAIVKGQISLPNSIFNKQEATCKQLQYCASSGRCETLFEKKTSSATYWNAKSKQNEFAKKDMHDDHL